MANANQVQKLYRSVVDDVISNVREAFLDEGLDDQVLLELKQIWESKLMQSKAVDAMPTEQDQVLLGQYNALQEQQKLQKRTIQLPVHGQPRPAQGAVRIAQPATVPMLSNFAGRIDMGGYGGGRYRNHMPHYNHHMMPNQHAPHHVHSQAAAAAAVALPTVYQQQFPPGSITLQHTDQGTFILQPAPHQGQVVSTSTLPLQTLQAAAPIQAGQVKTVPIKGVPTTQGIIQLDGANDTSSEDDDFDEDDKDDDDEEQNEEENEYQGEEEEPLNSADDISDGDPADLFDTDNVVVCQYDKINRCKNKWKFHLKDGIMNLRGKDYVFQRANGEAEW